MDLISASIGATSLPSLVARTTTIAAGGGEHLGDAADPDRLIGGRAFARYANILLTRVPDQR